MPNRTVSDLGEHALIERITSRMSMPPWVAVGPGDDAAVVAPPRGGFDVLTVDALVEGVHFDRRFMPPDAIGYRALAVNLSDLAAMGAEPRTALLSLGLPDTLPVADLDGLLDGLFELAGTTGTTLVGGNITRSPSGLMVTITAIGSVRPRRTLLRSGARAGDDVYVTGSLGAAAVGLATLRAAADGGDGGGPGDGDIAGLAECQARFLRPEPRMRAGIQLGRNRAASACMDLSDGLADGLTQMARASGVGLTIDADALPIDAAVRQWCARRGSDPVAIALGGGDDYELLFTVRPSSRGRLRGVRRLIGGLPVTKIGVVTRARDLVLRRNGGTTPIPAGYEHFR